jgi:erythromycin esterase-like protein
MSVNTLDDPRCLHAESKPTGLDSGRKLARAAKGATFFNRRSQALAMEQQFSLINLPEAFDAVIYFDKATPSRPLGE